MLKSSSYDIVYHAEKFAFCLLIHCDSTYAMLPGMVIVNIITVAITGLDEGFETTLNL